MEREWFFIVAEFQGRPILIDRPFSDYFEADQAGMRETHGGSYHIVSFPTRDKIQVRRLWRQDMTGNREFGDANNYNPYSPSYNPYHNPY